MSSARIFVCQCSFAHLLPGDVQTTVLQALHQAKLPFQAATDLCQLAATRDPSLKAFAAQKDTTILACYPRAVKCLFAAAGAPLDPATTTILNLRAQTADQIIAALHLPPTQPAPVENTPSPEPTPTGWYPWFPIIDSDRCTGCMQCLNFCLFGVFAVNADSAVEVKNPANCKTNCPACSRVCPQTAILFPKYKSGPINGDDSAPATTAEPVKVNLAGLMGGDVYSTLRNRTQPSRRFALDRDPNQAFLERQRCLAKLIQSGDIPPEALANLPSDQELQRRAEDAAAKAKAALDQKNGPNPSAPSA